MIKLLNGIDSTTAALSAEKLRMEIISQNIANAHVTRTEKGGPYQRQQVIFESMLKQKMSTGSSGTNPIQVVRVARVESDKRPPVMVHMPNHPDCNAQGMVAMPDINIHEEMVDLITASRAFEANLAVMKFSRKLATETLAIGRS